MEGVEGNVNEALDIAGGSVAGHEYIAEGIDGGLNQHVGNGEQGALNTGRKSDAYHLGKLRLVKAHFLKLQAAGIGALHQSPNR